MSKIESHPLTEPHILADHPVLDFLNTQTLVNGMPLEYFQTGEDVLRWLKRIGITHLTELEIENETALVSSARTLRDVVRNLIIERKNGGFGDLRILNDYLAKTPSFLQLRKDAQAGLVMERVAVYQNPESILAPLAEMAMELLAHGNFMLVRKCEHSDCILWFYDRTKSHRRRWCSMALCGNRNKVERFRKRQIHESC